MCQTATSSTHAHTPSRHRPPTPTRPYTHARTHPAEQRVLVLLLLGAQQVPLDRRERLLVALHLDAERRLGGRVLAADLHLHLLHLWGCGGSGVDCVWGGLGEGWENKRSAHGHIHKADRPTDPPTFPIKPTTPTHKRTTQRTTYVPGTRAAGPAAPPAAAGPGASPGCSRRSAPPTAVYVGVLVGVGVI